MGLSRFERPYDIVLGERLQEVRARRRHPDGQVHPVARRLRGSTAILVYPWDKMELGDFFIAPIEDRSEKAMRVVFSHTSARRDIELSVFKYDDPNYGPSLRVTLVLFNLKHLKRSAELHHNVKGLFFSDGRWSETRKLREKRKRDRVIPAAPAPRQPEPERHFTREEVIRRALEQ